jgi:pyruvate dehydrogenase E2 component (dihydrolipoamide acetyltransferase)
MADQLKLPELGEGIEEAQVLSVLVSKGDIVKKDQTVIEVETEKATAEVPSELEGKVTEVHVEEGKAIRVGDPIISVEAGPAGSSKHGNGAEPRDESDREEGADSQTEADAEAGAKKQSADKTRAKGRKRRRGGREEDPLDEPGKEGDAEEEPDGEVEPEPSSRRTETRPPQPRAPAAPAKIVYLEEPETGDSAVPASPSVRRLARELGVAVGGVPGTGPGGRISAEDVKSFARRLIVERTAQGPQPVLAARAAAPGGRAAPALPDFSQWGEVEREPMTALRRAAADVLATAWAQAPMVTQFDRADITELETFRERYGSRVEAAGGKLTVTAVAVKVAAAALRIFPRFNASLDIAEQEIVLKHYVHVGVAVDTPGGLMVPVIRDADTKNVTEIAVELGELAERARNRKISLDELKGGSFSVSNLGGLGTTYFSPIVNWPEVAILGLGRAAVEAVHRDGAFVPRRILPLAVTYDHRLIDGADAARFLRWIAEALENPMLLALEG